MLNRSFANITILSYASKAAEHAKALTETGFATCPARRRQPFYDSPGFYDGVGRVFLLTQAGFARVSSATRAVGEAQRRARNSSAIADA